MVDYRIVKTTVDQIGTCSRILMNISSRWNLVMKVVTLETKYTEESLNTIQIIVADEASITRAQFPTTWTLVEDTLDLLQQTL